MKNLNLIKSLIENKNYVAKINDCFVTSIYSDEEMVEFVQADYGTPATLEDIENGTWKDNIFTFKERDSVYKLEFFSITPIDVNALRM